MTFQEWVWDFILSAGAATMVSGALVFWLKLRLKSSIEHEYDQKLETLKAQLAAQNNTELERLKGELQVAAAERSIRLNAVAGQAIDGTMLIYRKLVAVNAAVNLYTSVVEYKEMGTKAQRRTRVGEAMYEFWETFRHNKPFLPRTVADEVEKLAIELHKLTNKFRFGVEEGGDQRKIARGIDVDTWSDADKFMTGPAYESMRALEDEVRYLIGIQDRLTTQPEAKSIE